MSFLIPVDWPGEGSSALCGFTKDAYSLTVTTGPEEWPYTVLCVWVHASVCVCVSLIFEFSIKLLALP